MKMAAMAPERGGGGSSSCNNNNGRTLHNFSLPPCLSWGTQKLLRCSNSTSSLNDTVSPSHPSKRSRNSPFHNGGDGIQVIREKLMLDLRSEVDKMRAAFLAPPPPPQLSEATAEVRRWNLRTRRAVWGGGDQLLPLPPSPQATASAEVALVAEDRGECDVTAVQRAKFSAQLTRQEVEDDFVAMVGRRPPRKPKKRPRYIQKELETIFPGVWLSEITADMYKVNETPEPPK